MKRFLAHAGDHYGQSSTEQSHFRLALAELDAHRDEPAASFGPVALRGVRDAMVASDRWVRNGVNQYVSRVVAAFKWGVSHELIPVATYQALRTVESLRLGRTKCRESKRVNGVAEDVVEATLPHLGRVLRDVVRLLWLTGMRPSECLSMRLADLDRSADVWVYAPQSHKTLHRGKDRRIGIGPKAQAVLKRYMLRPEDAYCFSPRESEQERLAERHRERVTAASTGNYPGSNRRRAPRIQPGECYSSDSLRRAVTRACGGAGVEPWTPYQLRHAVSTRLRDRYDLATAATVLGHDASVAQASYVDRDLATLQRVAQEIG